jgi:hypothetical protein
MLSTLSTEKQKDTHTKKQNNKNERRKKVKIVAELQRGLCVEIHVPTDSMLRYIVLKNPISDGTQKILKRNARDPRFIVAESPGRKK